MLWIRVARFALRLATSVLRRARPAVDRAEAAEELAEVLAAPVQPLAALGQEQAQVGPGVAVERREDLVDVRVRRGVGERDRVAVLELVVVRVGVGVRARVELEEHVLQARLRAEQDRRVLVDRQELAVDVHRHDRVTVLVVDGRDVADANAGHPDRLALAGGHGLGGREVGLELEGLLLEQRDPQALVLDDDVRREQADRQEAEDRQEIAQVVSDRLAHQPFAPFTGLDGSGSLMPFARWNEDQSLLHPVNCLSTVASSLLGGVVLARRLELLHVGELTHDVRVPRGEGVLLRARGGDALAARLRGRRRADLTAEIGRILGLTRHVGTERRLRGRLLGRLRAEEAVRRDAGQRCGQVGGAERRDGVGAASTEHAELLPVRVSRAALSRHAREPVRRLLVDLRRGRIAVAVRNPGVAPGDDDVVEAGGQSPPLLEERKRVVAERCEVGHRGPQVLDQATELVLGDQLAELADPRVRVVERLVGGLHAGKGLAREGAKRGEVLVQLEQSRPADGERLGQLDDRVAQRGLVGGEVAADRVEVGDQALQVAAVGVQLLGDDVQVRDESRQVAGLRAEQRLVHLGGVLVSRRRGPEGLLEALGASVAVEGAAELLEEDLQVLPHGRLQRGEDLVELDRARGLALRDHRAAVQLGSAGAARVQIDEQVAL